MTKKISRSQWEQIHRRAKLSNYKFDPKWKCLIDGIAFDRCPDHNEDDNEKILVELANRLNRVS